MYTVYILIEYFELLFNPDVSVMRVPKVPRSHKYMILPSQETSYPTNTEPVRARGLAIGQLRASMTELLAAMNSIKLTSAEFMRVNMRLAEDRILSFVAVFSTGYGTKWNTKATFFYKPEVRWESLLTQRRRWLNGMYT